MVQDAEATPPLTHGGELGFKGIPRSVAVSFDSHFNVEENDPFGGNDHIAIHTMGLSPNDSNHALSERARFLLPVETPGWGAHIHDVTITYNGATHELNIEIRWGSTLLGSITHTIDLLDTIGSPDGRAYIGIMATSGLFNITSTFNELWNWEASFAGGGENVVWIEPAFWDAGGYQGDVFDHQILDPLVVNGDSVQEKIEYVSDTMGGLTELEKQELANDSTDVWTVEARGALGLWRNANDVHDINPISIAYPTLGSSTVDTGTVEIVQIMTVLPEERIYARNCITFRFVKIPSNSVCYEELFKYHRLVEKAGASNPTIYPDGPDPNNNCP